MYVGIDFSRTHVGYVVLYGNGRYSHANYLEFRRKMFTTKSAGKVTPTESLTFAFQYVDNVIESITKVLRKPKYKGEKIIFVLEQCDFRDARGSWIYGIFVTKLTHKFPNAEMYFYHPATVLAYFKPKSAAGESKEIFKQVAKSQNRAIIKRAEVLKDKHNDICDGFCYAYYKYKLDKAKENSDGIH